MLVLGNCARSEVVLRGGRELPRAHAPKVSFLFEKVVKKLSFYYSLFFCFMSGTTSSPAAENAAGTGASMSSNTPPSDRPPGAASKKPPEGNPAFRMMGMSANPIPLYL